MTSFNSPPEDSISRYSHTEGKALPDELGGVCGGGGGGHIAAPSRHRDYLYMNPYRPGKESCQGLEDEISKVGFGFMPGLHSERSLVTVGKVALISLKF